MAALTGPRATPVRQTPRTRTIPVAANAIIRQGGMVQINAAGYAVPASATAAMSPRAWPRPPSITLAAQMARCQSMSSA
jgi:hypothetical protein